MIQILMGWWDYHLFDFEVAGRRWVGPDNEPFWDEDIGEDARAMRLRDLGLRKGATFEHRYDFGDDWRMRIEVERRRHGGPNWTLPWLLDGERAGPPEDCGGVRGLRTILVALAGPGAGATGEDDDEFDDPDDDERERRELIEWLGDYDPTAFDRRTINHFLAMGSAWGALEPGA